MFPHRRGNVVITALFIAVFLFFLSVALLVANKQDIALSLSMEHKLKAEMAARSVAFEAYGHLREYGKLSGALGSRLEKDVTTRVELVELPATSRRGKLLDIRARGTSGPVSSYFTMRLQPTDLASASDGDGKVMLLPPSHAIYGNFELVELDEAMPSSLFANDGPAFTTSAVEHGTAPAFMDTLPFFTDTGDLLGLGPLVVVGPEPVTNTETNLQWLEYKGGAFEWQNIPPPDWLGGKPDGGTAPTYVYPMNGPPNWNHASAHGDTEGIRGWTWVDSDPPTSTVDEVRDSLGAMDPVAAPTPVPFKSGNTQHFYTTRGAIAAQGRDVYSHGWHYLYKPYQGAIPSEVTPLTGSLLMRWPCVLKYSTVENGWSIAWNPLGEDGSVKDTEVPDANYLWVTSKGDVYSQTLNGEKRLMQLESSGRVEVADETLPAGYLFFYRDQPWVLTSEPSRLINVKDQSTIDFHTLPSGIPGYHGTMLDIPQFQSQDIDEPGTNDLSPEGAFVIEGYKPLTVLPDFLLGYSFGTGKPIVSGNDLYMELQVSVDGVDSLYELFDQKYVADNMPAGGTVMARYDGERWHILPNGLRAFVDRERQSNLNSEAPPGTNPEPDENEDKQDPVETLDIPPGMANAVVATYPGLPANIPRYSVISITTDPFPMGDDD